MSIYIILIDIIIAVSLFYELRRDLMMLQQNSYRNDRYMRWIKTSGDTTSFPRLIALVLVFMALASITAGQIVLSLMGLFAIWNTYKLATAKYKKPLVMTRRAIRIIVTASLVSALLTATVALLASAKAPESVLTYIGLTMTALYCLSHPIIMLSNFILKPVENMINRRYYNEAAEMLRSMPGLKIIGITGSYGKTSTKHYLHRILSEHFDTLMTPGSFNTTLGVIRTVREYLKPYNEVFIVEMGAKQKGDIKEICDLVHPSVGIVTAVGPQHLESFKTIENVRDTKFELVDALPSDGLAVVNDDFGMIAGRKVDNVDCIRYAVNDTANAAYTVKDVTYSANGTDFVVVSEGKEDLKLHTTLVGECNISNLMAAVAVARALGVPDRKIKYAVERIEQVEHRLNLKRTPGGIVIIDDAFNSNPVGSGMALDVLSGMTGGKRIIITPGMIELGDRTYELNREFGVKIASSADVAIVVGQYNRDAIVDGLKEGGMAESKYHTVDSFAAAQQLLTTIVAPGDTVLYENDLPDTFK